MKKYVLIFILFLLIGVFYYYNPNEKEVAAITTEKSEFVSLSDKSFIKHGKPFYPVTINYIVGLQTDRNELWPSPSNAYYPNKDSVSFDKKFCRNQLFADLQLIKEMGFNSVRIIGIGDENIADEQTEELYIRASIGNQKDTNIYLANEKIYDLYFNAIEDFLNIMDSVGLKGILLTKALIGVDATKSHLEKLADRFKNNSTLMAYDFFNEPLYFDLKDRDKIEVNSAVSSWQNTIKQKAPFHLTTIGLEGIREVFEWDPNILPVDFISLHPYEYEPDQVRNEIYWYSKYIKKPWVLGETGIPADNDSVTYEKQREFAAKTLKQTYDCNAYGYSWWQYKDVEWGAYHANFLGLVNLKGETQTKNGHKIIGTPKVTVEEFQKFNSMAKKDDCLCLENYYNYSNGKEFCLKGKMSDDKGMPIEGGVVLGWNETWTRSFHTITKADGTFELLGEFIIFHWMASATEHSTIRGEIAPEKALIKKNIPTIDLGDLKVNKLNFQAN